MSWEQLAGVQRLITVRLLAFWFVATPLAASLLQSPSVRSLLGNTELPFSWYLFYSAATAFFIAAITYRLCCPLIIRDYTGWYDFSEREGSFEKLRPLIIDAAQLATEQGRRVFLLRHAQTGALKLVDVRGSPLMPDNAHWSDLTRDYRAVLQTSTAPKTTLGDVFSGARDLTQKTRRPARFVIFALHAIGFLFLSIVLVQNAASVLRSFCSGACPFLNTALKVLQ